MKKEKITRRKAIIRAVKCVGAITGTVGAISGLGAILSACGKKPTDPRTDGLIEISAINFPYTLWNPNDPHMSKTIYSNQTDNYGNEVYHVLEVKGMNDNDFSLAWGLEGAGDLGPSERVEGYADHFRRIRMSDQWINDKGTFTNGRMIFTIRMNGGEIVEDELISVPKEILLYRGVQASKNDLIAYFDNPIDNLGNDISSKIVVSNIPSSYGYGTEINATFSDSSGKQNHIYYINNPDKENPDWITNITNSMPAGNNLHVIDQRKGDTLRKIVGTYLGSLP